MHRFYLTPTLCKDGSLLLSERDSHHARHVLRVKEGERVIVLDGAGGELLCEVQKPESSRLRLAVTQRSDIPPLPYQITLLQAVPKGKIIENIIQKAAELGAHRIVPLLSDRVVAHLDDEGAAARGERWQITAIEAIKQCGSAWLPQVEAPLAPREYLARGEKFELGLVASLQSDGRHPREHFNAFHQEHGRMPKSVCVWVGPEGDFTPAEMNAIKSAGSLPITLGRLVLRSETAAVYCLSVINYELQSSRR